MFSRYFSSRKISKFGKLTIWKTKFYERLTVWTVDCTEVLLCGRPSDIRLSMSKTISDTFRSRTGWARHAITHTCPCTGHIKCTNVLSYIPKILHGVIFQLFLIHSFSTLLSILFLYIPS